MEFPKKPVIEETPTVSGGTKGGDRSTTGGTGRRLSSAEDIADRPVRSNFNRIIFILIGFVALVVVLGMLFVHSMHSGPGATTQQQGHTPTASPQ
jgi:hypothetical protein